MEDITIPILLKESSRRSDPSSSSSITDSSIDWNMSSKIDFSQFPRDIRDYTEANLLDIAEKLNEKLTEIQNELEAIVNPNLKVYSAFIYLTQYIKYKNQSHSINVDSQAQKSIDSVVQQIQELSEKLKELREKFNSVKKQFETVKKKRYDLFSKCLEHVAAEIDPVYKVGTFSYVLPAIPFKCRMHQDPFNSVQSLVNDHISAYAFILSDNPEEPYEGGINYSCIAPSKRFQPLQNLSGGEKTLASLALLFAFQRYILSDFTSRTREICCSWTMQQRMESYLRRKYSRDVFLLLTVINHLHSLLWTKAMRR